MPEKMKFDARVRFAGSRKDMEKLFAAMARFNVEVIDPEDLVPWREDGGWPLPIEEIFDARAIRGFTARVPSIKVPSGIRGGMRLAHIHVGNKAYFVSRAKFNSILRQTVRKLTERIR